MYCHSEHYGCRSLPPAASCDMSEIILKVVLNPSLSLLFSPGDATGHSRWVWSEGCVQEDLSGTPDKRGQHEFQPDWC